MQSNFNEHGVTENLVTRSPNQDNYSIYTENKQMKASLRKYPLSTTLKITHLLLMDILNIVFCALNSY